MITGELKSKIDKIWDTIWTGGLASPTSVIEQITYLMFMKLLDDNEIKKEGNAAALGVPYKSKIFKDGNFAIDKEGNMTIPYDSLRWSIFHNYEPTIMFETVRTYVFEFIKTVNGAGKDTAFSRFMKDAVFLIPTAKVLAVFYSWDSPGKNTGVGCHAFLQGIFLTPGFNQCLLCLLHCRQML